MITPREKWVVVSCGAQQIQHLAKQLEQLTMALCFMPESSEEGKGVVRLTEIFYQSLQICNSNMVYSMITDDSDKMIVRVHEEMHAQIDELMKTAEGKADEIASRNPFSGLPDFDLP